MRPRFVLYSGLFLLLLLAGLILRSRFGSHLVWQYRAPTDIHAFGTGPNGEVGIVTDANEIITLNSAGRVVSTVHYPAGSEYFTSVAVLADGRTIGVMRNGRAVCVRDNAIEWDVSLGSGLMAAKVAKTGNNEVWISAGGTGPALYHVSAEGKVQTRIPLPGLHGYTPPTVTPGGTIYYVQMGDLALVNGSRHDMKVLTALTPEGRPLWSYKGLFMAAYDSVVVAPGGNAMVANKNGLWVIDPSGKLVLFDKELRAWIRPLWVSPRGRVYLATRNGLRELDEQGRVLRTTEGKHNLYSPVVVSNGAIICYESHIPDLAVKNAKAIDSKLYEKLTKRYVCSYTPDLRLKWRYRIKDSFGRPTPGPGGTIIARIDKRTMGCFRP